LLGWPATEPPDSRVTAALNVSIATARKIGVNFISYSLMGWVSIGQLQSGAVRGKFSVKPQVALPHRDFRDRVSELRIGRF
jgi:hypothetical protein